MVKFTTIGLAFWCAVTCVASTGPRDNCGALVSVGYVNTDDNKDAMTSAVLSPDGRWYVMPNPSNRDFADLFAMGSLAPFARLALPETAIRRAKFSRFGSHVLVYDGTRRSVGVFSVATGERLVTHTDLNFEHFQKSNPVLSPDGKFTLRSGASVTQVLVNSGVTDQLASTGPGHSAGTPTAEFHPDGVHLVAYGKREAPTFYRIVGSHLELVREFKLRRPPFISRLVYSLDEHIADSVANPDDDRSHAEREADLLHMERPEFTPDTGAFSPDGRQFAVIEKHGHATELAGTRIRIWEVATGEPITMISIPGFLTATAIAFSPTGSHLAIGGRDGVDRVLFIDVAERRIVRRLYVLAGNVRFNSLAFRPDGRQLWASDDISPRIWHWNLE